MLQIQADSAQGIRIKLIKTLATKEETPIEAIIEGLNSTENHCVSKEIHTLLSEEKGQEVTDNGSGDKVEDQDLSTYANNLVDEVIAKAEKTTAEQNGEYVTEISTEKTETQQEQPDSPELEKEEEKAESEAVADDKLVETSVEIHAAQEKSVVEENRDNDGDEEDDEGVVNDTTSQPSLTADVNEPLVEDKAETSSDVPVKSVNFPETIDTVIEDEKSFEEDVSQSPVTSPTATEFQSHDALDNKQNESENEDVDDIDIEKEFVMPAEAERSLDNNNSLTNGKISEDTVLENGNDKTAEVEEKSKNDNAKIDEDAELAAALARKALVRQQVELFEKSSPNPGKVKYSFRTASQDKEQSQAKPEGNGSNVKNLKNFFQRLSTTTENTSSPPPSGILKILNYPYLRQIISVV